MRFEPILGLIGNVGPEADELLQDLIGLRSIREGASRDQEFLPATDRAAGGDRSAS